MSLTQDPGFCCTLAKLWGKARLATIPAHRTSEPHRPEMGAPGLLGGELASRHAQLARALRRGAELGRVGIAAEASAVPPRSCSPREISTIELFATTLVPGDKGDMILLDIMEIA